LLTSVVVAPLVLLRSDASVALGVQWFLAWETRAESSERFGDLAPEKRNQVLFASALMAAASVIVGCYIALHFLIRANDHQSFWEGLLIGWSTFATAGLLVGSTVALAGAAELGGFSTGSIGIDAAAIILGTAVAYVGAACVSTTVALMHGGIEAGLEAGFGTIVSLIVLLVATSFGAIAKTLLERGLLGLLILISATIIVGFFALSRMAEFGTIATLSMVAISLLFALAPRVFMILVFVPVELGYALGVLLFSLGIRFEATRRYLRFGLRALPQNFRRLILCTSPIQEPELVPNLGLQKTRFSFQNVVDELKDKYKSRNLEEKVFSATVFILAMLFWFLPAVLYRFIIKSTIWFWWQLAYLGSDLKHAKDPDEFRRRVIGSLWAKTNLGLSIITIAIGLLIVAWKLLASDVKNPLLTTLGYLLVVDWNVRPWHALALMVAVLAILIVYLIDDAGGQYQVANKNGNEKMVAWARKKFALAEGIVRLRLLLVVALWCIIGAQALLYFNSRQCWFNVPPNVADKAQWIYGDRYAPAVCY